MTRRFETPTPTPTPAPAPAPAQAASAGKPAPAKPQTASDQSGAHQRGGGPHASGPHAGAASAEAARVERPLAGIALIVSGMLLVPFMDAIAKHMAADYSVLQLVWARFFFHLTFLTPLVLILYGRSALRVRQPGLQLLRGGLLMMATMLFFFAIAVMPLVDALALLFISPLVVTAVSALVLKEPVGPRRWAAVAVGFLGALIVIRPGLGVFQWAALLAATAGVCHALYLLATRKLSGSAPPLVTLAFTAVIGAIAMSAMMPFVWRTPSLPDLALMACIGLIAAVGHFLLIRAFDHGSAAVLAPFTYTEVIMATLLGYFWFGDFPDAWSWLGIAILIGSGVYISWREHKRKVPHPTPSPILADS